MKESSTQHEDEMFRLTLNYLLVDSIKNLMISCFVINPLSGAFGTIIETYVS
jgi:hypothetical protein